MFALQTINQIFVLVIQVLRPGTSQKHILLAFFLDKASAPKPQNQLGLSGGQKMPSEG